MIALPESFINYDHDYLLKKMVDEFKQRYGMECFAALHHNIIIDSPAKGLHMLDLPCVMESLKKLIEKNNSVVIAENNPYFVYMSDWIINRI